MLIIKTNDVNTALDIGIQKILECGKTIESRVGKTIEIACPVTSVNEKPWQRVLLNKDRDANPFFHLFESLWILRGRDDVRFLTEFNKRMVEYSDNGETFNAPYGYRLRYAFEIDQLEEVVKLLQKDLNSRRAVCQLWDPKDLTKNSLDKACNMSIVFSVRDNRLNMIVYNRSNDIIWGLYGANFVQFSMIQEYVAAKLNLDIGVYTHVSNSYHVYTDGPGGEVFNKLKNQYFSLEVEGGYYDNFNFNLIKITHHEINEFEQDLRAFFIYYDLDGLDNIVGRPWKSQFFKEVVSPMLHTYVEYKFKGSNISRCLSDIKAEDWRKGAKIWLENRGVEL